MKTYYISLLLFISSQISVYSQCSATGSVSGANSADDPSVGLVGWTNSSNIKVSDDVRSTAGTLVSALATIHTHELESKGFGFSIPASATICGITVTIERREQGVIVGSAVNDKEVVLLKAGVATGTNEANASDWASSDYVITYGGPTDLWGTSWTASDINDPNFGVSITASLNAGLASVFLSAEVDQVIISVNYDVSTVLPIELISFAAEEKKGEGIELKWSTATEINNLGFFLERSSDGINFESISFEKGAGSSSQIHNYEYLDRYPQQDVSYYRLKQVDNNARYAYSAIAEASFNYETGVELLSSSEKELVLSVKTESGVQVELCDVIGRVMQSVNDDPSIGTRLVKINTSDLPRGFYMVKAQWEGKQLCRKIYHGG